MSSAGEVADERLFAKEGRGLGGEVKDGMFHAVAGWLEKQGEPDVRKERMAMFQRIHDALPSGKLKEFHEMGRGFAELDAKVAGWSGEGKNILWKVAKGAITAEFPPALFLPDNTPSILDAWMARIGGVVGEAVIRGGVGARERIDQIMVSMTSSGMKPLAQGGVA